ncbi:zinc finger protein [Trypanosoma melophagium]|uniref:zinc finger protein n=1 Tax=Trypanosoma melophagium TaxID=715481 RepID=UPI003519E8F6|nr:zinc finger protein [Trypanosoma melophagium]
MQSGLYIFRFIPPNSPPEGEKTTDSEKECHIPRSSEELVDWHVLLKITVGSEGLLVGSQGKIFVMEDECCANSGSSGEPVVISGLGRVLRPVKERNVTVVMRCPSRWQYAETLRLDIHFDKLEGHVVGLKDEMLQDVTVSYEGSPAYGGYIGEATIAVKSKPFHSPNRLRFVLDPYTGPLCTMCLDPIYAQGYGCSGCGMVEYCSSECQGAHMSGGHGLLCQKLKQNYTQSSEKVVAESEKGAEVVAWWRCLGDASYSILVDYSNELGQAIEFFMCTLKPAQSEGLRFRYIVEKGTTPKEVHQEELAEFACTVFSAVSKNSISKGCASLAAACLNYIFVFSRHIEDIVDSHFLYYSSYLSEDFEGTMSSVEEYVTYARPLHELGVALMEFALKSPTALLFWHRIKMAKNVCISLYNVDTRCQCSEIKELVNAIPRQQRETLHLLSKLFLIMASRAPKREGLRLLEQAERCLRDCLPAELKGREGAGELDGEEGQLEEIELSCLATLYFRLAVLLQLYGDANKRREAEALKAHGDALLAKAKIMQEEEDASRKKEKDENEKKKEKKNGS